MLNKCLSWENKVSPITFAQPAMVKRIINIFLVLILSVQILPIQQMGKLLFTNTFTEEIPHSLDTGPEQAKQNESKSDFIYMPEISHLRLIDISTLKRPVVSVAIPQNHTTEIHVPPPNC